MPYADREERFAAETAWTPEIEAEAASIRQTSTRAFVAWASKRADKRHYEEAVYSDHRTDAPLWEGLPEDVKQNIHELRISYSLEMNGLAEGREQAPPRAGSL